MIITVASGKGGTGKTTVATNLSISINKNIQLLDCDVEEPNVHIFLKPEIKNETKAMAMVPEVDKSLCTKCGECEKICQFSAIALVGKDIMTFPSMCHSCKGCMMVCPENAIKESHRELGSIYKGKKGLIDIVYGQLRVGEAMSPPLIDKVKENIDPEKINIIDAPPGTSCPVIAAIKKSDFILLVTEPTPFGLNDLILAVEAVRLMGIPFGIVINRCDVGDNKTKEYVQKENIPILMEIKDDKKIAQAYSKGLMITDVMPEMKEEFIKLYNSVKNYIKG